MRRIGLRFRDSIQRSTSEAKDLLGLPRPLSAVLIFLTTLLMAVPLFNQGDLNHTVVSSYAYLKGHFLDFYDFNQPVVWANDYLPILYIIFAIWMAPYFFSGMPIASNSVEKLTWGPGEIVSLSGTEIVWAKLLLILFFWFSVVILFRIAKHVHPHDKGRQSVVVWAYVLSPFVLFSLGVFSQYDIIGVVFTLAAIYKLLQREMVGFAVLIGIALTFKFFAAILVIPLLLLATKNFVQVIRLGLISLIPLLIQFAFYWPNESFQARIFVQLTSKAGGAATSWELYVGAIAYLALIVAAYASSRWKGTFEQKIVFVILASYGLMLNMVVWHPQWVILLAPFIALMMGFLPRPSFWISWESVAFLAFIGFVVTFFQGNVDGVMISRGALGSFIPATSIPIMEFYPAELYAWMLPIVKVFFLSPALVVLIQMFRVESEQRPVQSVSWVLRSLTIWIAFIGPAFAAIYLPEILTPILS